MPVLGAEQTADETALNLTCCLSLPSSLCISSTRVTASSPLSGCSSCTLLWISCGRMVRNCSNTSSSRICSLVRISGRSHPWQSSWSRLRASRGPAASWKRNRLKRKWETSGLGPGSGGGSSWLQAQSSSSFTIRSPSLSWEPRPDAIVRRPERLGQETSCLRLIRRPGHRARTPDVCRCRSPEAPSLG